jgi:anti-sigma factor RsiW
VADRLGARERIALEAHAASCAECADALRNGGPVDAALRGAFAPLRERRTIIAPGRVRLAVGPRSPTPNPWLLAPRVFGRLTEVSVMLAVTLFAVGSSLEPSARASPSAAATRSVLQAEPPPGELDYLRWVRLVKPHDSPSISDAARLPVGGRFDFDPVEILKGPGASAR